MKQIIFDFSTWADRDAFYHQFGQQFQLDEAFGNNLDALWDVLTGEIELPVNIVFRHAPHHSRTFQPIIEIMQEVQETLGKELFRFHCEHKKAK